LPDECVAKPFANLSEDNVREALKLAYERMKLVIEPSSAITLAAVLKNKEMFARKKIGIIFTGGNVDLIKFSEWFE
jgi:threonine dehydratase